MEIKNIIESLKSLIIDRESFIENENDKEDIFIQDKEALEEAIRLLERKIMFTLWSFRSFIL